MRKSIIVAFMIFLALLAFSEISIANFKYDDVEFSFPVKSITKTIINNQEMLSIDLNLYIDTIFLPRDIVVSDIKLVLLMFDKNGELKEVKVPMYAFKSDQLNNELIQVSKGGNEIPYNKESGYTIPKVASSYELESEVSDQVRFFFKLPEKWFMLWKIEWGDEYTEILEDSFNVEISSFDKANIEKIFTAHHFMTKGFKLLYSIYEKISEFEVLNNSLPTINEIESSDIKVSENYSNSTEDNSNLVSLYEKADRDFMKKLHERVIVEVNLTDIGLFTSKKGIKVGIENNAEIGTIKSVKFKYRVYDPFGELLTSGEHSITDLSVSPGESNESSYSVTNIFGGNPLEEAERIESEIMYIKWSNGAITE